MAVKKKIWIIIGVIFGVIIILAIIGSFIPNEEEKRLEAEKAEQEEERQRIIQYNREHIEEHYQKGLEFIKEKNYKEALEMFNKVISVDEDYKDIQKQILNANDTIAKIKREEEEARAKIKREKELADAKQMIIDAKKLSKSNNCGEVAQGYHKKQKCFKSIP